MRSWLVALVFLAAGPAAASTLSDLIVRHGFGPEEVAVLIEDSASGRTLAEHRADALLMPASTLKLVTAVGALDRLGADFRFETALLAAGDDLVLRGTGDPLLDLDQLMALADALHRTGTRRVAGRFVVDDSARPLLPVINPEQPVEAGYNAGIGALNLAFNRSERRPVGGGSLTVPPLAERSPAWTRLPMNQPATVPVGDPGMHTARVFQSLAISLGIDLPEPVRAAPPPVTRLIARIESRPLRDMVGLMLLYSNNQVAELVGLAATGAGSLAESVALLAADVRERLPEIDWRGFSATNHSGLDPKARATPRQLLAILRLAEERHAILPLLPAAAWSGSLQSRFRTPETALRVWAKTGSLDYASALVGFVLRDGRPPLRIAVLIGDLEARGAYDAVEVKTAAMKAAADAYELRARDLRDAIAGWALGLAD